MVNYNENIYLNQNRDLKLFYKKNVVEEILSPFRT